MLLQPKKVKHRKWQKGRSKGIESRGNKLAFGSFGLKAMEAKWIRANQIEAARRAITRGMKKRGKVWIRIFPYKPITSKGTEFPMGGGKGSVDHYVCPVKPGRVMFEVSGVAEDTARTALRKASDKLPLKTKFVKE